jgi:hypothetical protein
MWDASMNDAELEFRTMARTVSGQYHFAGRLRMTYVVQPGDPKRGVEVGYDGGVDGETLERLRVFRAGVEQLVTQRASEGCKLVGIDIVVEFLDACPPNECHYGYAFMYDVVESETEPCIV